MSTSAHGHDVQVCLSNAIKLLSEMCVAFSLNHPLFSLSILFLFLLCVAFPFAFWVLVYSIPLVVCTAILLSLPFNVRGSDQPKDEANEVDNNAKTMTRQTPPPAPHDSNEVGKKKKPITRVHSVRRRRAKEFTRDREKAEDKNAGSETVDKNTLNNPKEIREVEVVQGPSIVNDTKSTSSSPSRTSKHENDESGDQSTKAGNNTNDIIIISNNNTKAAMSANDEDDHQKNKMDVVISDTERTKRLESLIARRRLRKLLGLELKRTLMNKDRNQENHQNSSLVVPKNNMGRLLIPSSNNAGPHSPVPGSAPSVLIPMRNPFDLPYDPQEEKLDLTGDGFEQEFMPANTRDMMMFCRHESFRSGTFLPGHEYNRNRNEISSTVSKSKPIVNSQIIQVRENGSEEGDIDDDVRTRAAPQEEEEDSSSEEDDQVFKIDREAILKSLSSMARRNPLQEETETTDNDNEQLREHLSRLKERCYYTDSMTATGRHAASYSIASDLQVEVSEVSSPPLTVDENSSYLDNDDDNRSTYDADSWASSSHLDLSQVSEYEPRLAQVDEDNEEVFSRGGVPESHCDHPWCSIAEYPDSCRTTRATNLDDKIDKTLQRSLSLLSQSSSRDDSMKSEECSPRFNKSEELNTVGSVKHSRFLHESIRNRIGKHSTIETTPDEGHLSDESQDMEHSSSSEDSEERLQFDHQEIAVIEDQVGFTQHSEDEQSSGEGTSITRAAIGSTSDHRQPSSYRPSVAFEIVHVSPSPKSVLHPASFDHYIDDEVRSFDSRPVRVSPLAAHQDSADIMEQSPDLPGIDGDLEHNVNPEEAACGRAQLPSRDEAPAEPTEETSSSASLSMDDEASYSKENVTAFVQSTDHSNDTIHSLSTEEELSEHQEILIEETMQDDSKDESSSYGVRIETSALDADKGHNQEEEESSTSDCIDGAKDEFSNSVVDRTTKSELSVPVEDDVSSESYNTNEEDRKSQQHHSSHESMTALQGQQETNDTLTEDTKY